MPSHYKNQDKLWFDTFTIKMLLMTTYVITSATNNLVARCAFYKKDSESVFCKKSILQKMIQYSPLTRSPMGQKLIYGGNLRFKIDWASLKVGSKFTVFALFYFVFEGNFPGTSPRGLIFGGAIKRRSYFRNFTVN